MRAPTLAAEWFWVRHRLLWRAGTALALLLAVGVPAARCATTSPDLAAAIDLAERQSAEATARGLDLPAWGTYVEPRYLTPEQLPVDVAGLAVAVALIALVCAALCVGAEWRTGSVRWSWAQGSARGRPALARVGVWSGCWFLVGLVCAGIGAGGLVLVGQHTGIAPDLGAQELGWLVLRAGLVAGLGALTGASLATVLRSDTAVVVLVLLYVLVAELVLMGLNGAAGYRSPGTRLFRWIISSGSAPDPGWTCAGALRCSELYRVTAGPVGAYVLVAVAALVLGAVAAVSARRPVWRT